MIVLTSAQISGAVAGGLVGGFCGFVANSFQERQQFRRARRNIACALIGDIGVHPLGSNIGAPPSPLPRDLVRWYTRLAVCLERAHVLHELALQPNPERMTYMADVAELQHAGFTELIELARPLIGRLSAL